MRFIHKRAWGHTSIKVNDILRYKTMPVCVTNILEPEEFEYVEWAGQKPLFIEVFDDDGEVFLAHPSDLRRKR